MILAAGLGTRLRPLTAERPKPLIELRGRPLITYALRLLRHHGITDVVINVHYQGAALRAALGDGSTWGVHIEYSPEDPLLDTGGAIKKVEGLLAADDDFLVLNGDTVSDVPLARLLTAHRERGATATLVLRQDPEQSRYGVIETDSHDRIVRFLGHPPTVPGPLRPYMFAGIHVLSRRVFAFMPPVRPFSITRETYPTMLDAGEAMYGFPFDGFWRVIDTPADLARATDELEGGARLHYMDEP